MIARLLLVLLCSIPTVVAAHSLTSNSPFENGLSHFRDGDYTTAYAEWLEAAEEGDSGAEFGLALMYYTGKGVTVSPEAAFAWMFAAATKGNYNAQNNLGVMYLEGNGVPKNRARAYAWYALASEQGQTDAKKNVDLLASKLSAKELAEANLLVEKIKKRYSP